MVRPIPNSQPADGSGTVAWRSYAGKVVSVVPVLFDQTDPVALVLLRNQEKSVVSIGGFTSIQYWVPPVSVTPAFVTLVMGQQASPVGAEDDEPKLSKNAPGEFDPESKSI
jgi:hypothetical protein